MSILLLIIIFFPALLLLLYLHHILFLSKYWSKRNVPHLKPVFLLGNAAQANITENFVHIIKKIYLENRKSGILGIWVYREPVLIVSDPDLIRRILIRDFDVFHDRQPFDNAKADPLAGHLFLLTGKPWRNLRVKLTSTFTSGKMKMMFPNMMDCGNQLREHLVRERGEIEVKDLMARFTTDVISSCAFGIETNSMKNPNSEFRKYGNRGIELTIKSIIFNALRFEVPNLLKFFKFRIISKEVSNFFINLVKETIAYRKENHVTRNDFLQLLIQLIDHGKVKEAERHLSNGQHPTEGYKITELEAAAQCFVFFLAGFETSSTALTFGLYELAQNPDIQIKLQNEIDEAFSEGEITYEKLHGMPYLDMIVHEILRKYPSLGQLVRMSSKEYKIPELNVTISRNTRIMIPALGIHRNPDYYPEPDKFDPERFSPEEKKKRIPMTYLPFGDGPRNCIGSRFGIMQIKIGLVSALRDNTVEVSENTPIPYSVDIRSIFLPPKGGLPLLFKKRV